MINEDECDPTDVSPDPCIEESKLYRDAVDLCYILVDETGESVFSIPANGLEIRSVVKICQAIVEENHLSVVNLQLLVMMTFYYDEFFDNCYRPLCILPRLCGPHTVP